MESAISIIDKTIGRPDDIIPPHWVRSTSFHANNCSSSFWARNFYCINTRWGTFEDPRFWVMMVGVGWTYVPGVIPLFLGVVDDFGDLIVTRRVEWDR